MKEKLPIKISASAFQALSRVKDIYSDVPYVRIGVKGGAGCGSMAYTIGLDKKTEKDVTYLSEGIQFAIEKGQLMHLVGLEVDYKETEFEQGFVFNNEPLG